MSSTSSLPIIPDDSIDTNEQRLSRAAPYFPVIFVSLCIFFCMYYILYSKIFNKIFPDVTEFKNKFYSCNYMISFIHSVLLLIIICIDGHTSLTIPSIDQLHQLSNPNAKYICAISLGYFIYDFLALLIIEKYYFNKIDFLMLLHHFITMPLLFGSLTTNYGIYATFYGLYIAEITNPLLHISGVRKWTTNNSSINTIFDILLRSLFVILFMVYRQGAGTYFMYALYASRCPWIVKWPMYTVWILSLIWLPTLLRFIIRQWKKYLNGENKSQINNILHIQNKMNKIPDDISTDSDSSILSAGQGFIDIEKNNNNYTKTSIIDQQDSDNAHME